jgi:hypothetical protein
MAKKQIIFSGVYQDREQLMYDVYKLETLSGTQQSVVLLCSTGLLPAQVTLEQRTPKGPIDVAIGNSRFKISQRAKVTEKFAYL